MKIAILSESPADEAALRILVEGLLNSPTEVVPTLPRSRDYGWPAVLRIAKNVVNHVYYRTDADGLVISVDSDDSPVHRESADTSVCDAKCRICQLRAVVANVVNDHRAIPGHAYVFVLQSASRCLPLKLGIAAASILMSAKQLGFTLSGTRLFRTIETD